MNQQHMNMAGMNTAGGPVGGAPMMANGPTGLTSSDEAKIMLNTYVYDYFLKNQHYDVARAIVSSEMPIKWEKASPNRRDLNGVGDGMDTDNKDDVHRQPDDLPKPDIPGNAMESCFLFDWWGQFWDVFNAHRNRGKPSAVTYLHHQRQMSQMRQAEQNRMLGRVGPPMMNDQYRQMMQGMQPNGMAMPNELQKRALSNNRNATPQQLAQMNKMQQMMQTNMQREGSGMDMNQRPQSPGSGDNAPSPKRQRLDGNTMNGQLMGPAGRGQGMQQMGNTSNTAAMAGQMLMQNGINPGDINPQQFNAFQAAPPNTQQKSIEVYAQSLAQQQRSAMINQNSGKAMNPGGVPQGSPMTQPNPDGPEIYFAQNRMQGGAPGNTQGNHALQDYQMQLMLLEQQNKKRLLMARQEQDNLTQHPPGSAPMGQPGFAPAMSPSRSGPSPNPTEMKRGTPKMGQTVLPGSPLPDGSMPQNRSSPAGNFNPGQIPPGVQQQQYYAQLQANGMMRPPTTHPGFGGQGLTPEQMEMIARGHRMPNGAMWSQPPPQMMQQGQGQQPMPIGTPQQRNITMPPPPAPAGGTQPGGAQPAPETEQPANAPPTPSQAPKGNPKSKKETKETRKKPTKKGAAAATGVTPAATEAEPATPTPATPITPRHQQSFNNQGNAAAPAGNMQAPPPAAGAPQPSAPPPMDPIAAAPFGTVDGTDNGMNMDFGPLDSDNVLENFDFESFLHTDNDMGGLQFDTNFGFGGDVVEAGAGDV